MKMYANNVGVRVVEIIGSVGRFIIYDHESFITLDAMPFTAFD